jgi:surfactin synthase thioesterase subunit
MEVVCVTAHESVWFRRFKAVDRPRSRLVCLPHAGGGASVFRNWPSRLPADVELLAVCYPGRQDRIAEPCVDQLASLADALTTALVPTMDTPTALFGHSMGASIAYEVAWRLEGQGLNPTTLFLSGQQPPALFKPPQVDADDDEALIAEVTRLGGNGADYLRDPDMRDLLMPAIRGDFALTAAYRPVPTLMIDTPIVAYVGDQDCDVTVEETAAWSQATTGHAENHIFPGDHFYLTPCEDQLVANVVNRLTGQPVA